MKKLKIFFTLFLIAILFSLFYFKNLMGNLYSMLIEKEYLIPDESSVFSFEATKMNDGSGDYWLYGEDENYFYAITSTEKGYSKISKIQAEKIPYFDQFNFKNWEIIE